MNFDKSADGLLPAVVQDLDSGAVLMLGYMNDASLKQTQESGWVTFFSRSKQRLWTKGEDSGNRLQVVEIREDCDQDALLIIATPLGPTCHTGAPSCFGASDRSALSSLARLERTVLQRLRYRPAGSYIASLAERGLDRMAQKVGEEAIETVIAAKNADDDQFVSEAADLLFHLTVLLNARGKSLADVASELERRAG